MEQNKYAEMFSTELKEAFRTKLLSENYSQELVENYLSKIEFPQFDSAVDSFVENLNKKIPSTNEMLKKSDGSQSPKTDRISLVSFADKNLKDIAVNLRKDFIGRQMSELASVAEDKGIKKEEIQAALQDIRQTHNDFSSVEDNPPIFNNFIAEARILTQLINEAKKENLDTPTSELSSSLSPTNQAKESDDQDSDLDQLNSTEDDPDESSELDASQDPVPDSIVQKAGPLHTMMEAIQENMRTSANGVTNVSLFNDIGNLSNELHLLSQGKASQSAQEIGALITNVKDGLGEMNDPTGEISTAMRELTKLQSELKKLFPEVPVLFKKALSAQESVVQQQDNSAQQLAIQKQDNPTVESNNPDGKLTHKSFPEWIKEAGKVAGLTFAGNKDNLFQFSGKVDKADYKVDVTVDSKNPNNFLIQGTNAEKIANLVRAIHKDNPSIPLTFKMGNNHNQNLELLDKLTNSTQRGGEVAIKITTEQAETMRSAFSTTKDHSKLNLLNSIITKQEQLSQEQPQLGNRANGPR